ncbi:hypothetical protein [Ectopseudomonas khazarica]|uniref:hypothetical protein n=1 Tax=Ectopseudomonas khazarica TaxID=2502979 RepID=UPI0037C8057E
MKSFVVAFVVVLQLVISIAVQVLIVRLVGVGIETDVFVAVQAFAIVITTILVSACQSAWVPRFSTFEERGGSFRDELSVAQGQMTILGGVFLLFILTCGFWFPLLFSVDVGGGQLYFVTIAVGVAAFFNTLSTILTLAIRVSGGGVIGESIGLLGAVCSLILVVLIVPVYGLEGAVLIVLFRSVLVWALSWRILKYPSFSMVRGGREKEAWLAMRPLLYAGAIYKTAPIFDRYWISKDAVGVLTVYTLAQTAMSAFATVIDRSLCIPFLPIFSKYAEAARYSELRRSYRGLLLKVAALFVLFILAFVLVREWVVGFLSLFVFDEHVANMFWLFCVCLIGYSFGVVSGNVLVAVFYALKNTVTPTKIGMVGFFLGLAIKVAAYFYGGTIGVLLSISIYYLVNVLFLIIFLEVELNERVSG